MIEIYPDFYIKRVQSDSMYISFPLEAVSYTHLNNKDNSKDTQKNQKGAFDLMQ